MAYKIFDWPYNTPQDEYPAGAMVKFGKGYRFAAKSPGPEEIITHLSFPAMFVYQPVGGGAPDRTVDPQLNIYALEAFYKEHRMFQPFQWTHPYDGTKVCRFNKPLIMPKTMKTNPGEVGGRMVAGVSWRIHQVEPFDLELLWTQV